MKWALLFLSLVLTISCEEKTNAIYLKENQNVIYGEDTRRDLSSQNLVGPAKATVKLASRQDFSPLPNGQVNFRKFKLRQGYPLCETEKFLDQYLLGFCSGVLIGPQKVLTAGHCLHDQKTCEDTFFIFGFTQDKSVHGMIRNSDIYTCKKLLAQANTSAKGGMDYAIVELDRPVTQALPVKIIDTTNLAAGTRVVSLSYPLGLPLKADVGSVARNESWSHFIEASVDTFAGSSGSGLFDSAGNLLGILSIGSDDFLEDDIHNVQTNGGCIKVNNCANGTCHNERFFRATLIPN